MQKQMCLRFISHVQYDNDNQLPKPRILGFFFFSGEARAAEASAQRCSMGGDVMSHSSAAALSTSLPSSVSGVSAIYTSHGAFTMQTNN